MPYPSEILNEIKWKYNGLGKVDIYYTNYGSLNDTSIINGGSIESIGGFIVFRSNLVDEETHIPQHRIKKIVFDGEVVYEKR